MPSDASPPRPKSRDFALDLVRAIAIIEVVLAHSALPPLLFQLRNFGVPLLLVVSGMAFALRFGEGPFSAPRYILRRVLKLLVPTWAFLVFFFALCWALDATGIMPGRYGWNHIIGSFLLQNDAGYIWVIRVNLLVSLLAGLLMFIDRRTTSLALVLVVLAALVANELLWRAFITSPLSVGALGQAIKQNAFYALSFGAMFLLGMRLARLPRWSLLALAGLAALVFAGLALWFYGEAGVFVPTQSYKYPPRVYYIAYALAVSLALLAFRNELAALVPAGWPRHLLGFIGANTLWIFLWHVLALRLVDRLVEVTPLPDHWAITWALTVILSVLATWLQQQAWTSLRALRPGIHLRR